MGHDGAVGLHQHGRPVARSRTVLDLEAQRQPLALQDWGGYWIDARAQAQAQQVSTAPDIKWQPTNRHAVYPLRAGQALWIRFTLPPAPDAGRWYLEMPYPSINRVSLFTRDSAGQWAEQKAGDLVPVARWPVPHRYPLLPIAVSAEVQRRYLVRIENGHSFSAPLQFVRESYRNHSEQRISLILGIFFGLAGLARLVAIVSAISALSLRDPAYGFYALAVTASGLAQACICGRHGPGGTTFRPRCCRSLSCRKR